MSHVGNRRVWLGSGLGVGMALFLGVVAVGIPGSSPAGGNTSKYIGAQKCKNCHQDEKTGNQHAKWQASKHAKAFDLLATPAAKTAGKEKGVDDPQSSPKCLKCHVTAYGAPPDRLAASFDPKLGVQCESCHGPGEAHFKARFAAAAEMEEGDEGPQQVPAGEIDARPGSKTCQTCHNEESPSFKGFCFKKRLAEIAHPDPRKQSESVGKTCICGDVCDPKCGDCKPPKAP